MNHRRQFLKASLVVAGGVIVGSGPKVLAATTFPAGIIYTADNPGKWAQKVGSHAPKVTVEGGNVTILTAHPMSSRHYIVRHTLVSADGRVLGEKTFYPTDKKAVSTFQVTPGAGSRFYATSFCNLHDFWVTEFTL